MARSKAPRDVRDRRSQSKTAYGVDIASPLRPMKWTFSAVTLLATIAGVLTLRTRLLLDAGSSLRSHDPMGTVFTSALGIGTHTIPLCSHPSHRFTG
jgi:hypothetical protein